MKVHIAAKVLCRGGDVDRVFLVLDLGFRVVVFLSLLVLDSMHKNLCFGRVVLDAPLFLLLDGPVDSCGKCLGVAECKKLGMVVDVDMAM